LKATSVANYAPYVQSPQDGRSLTRAYLEAWFKQLNGPVEENVERLDEKTGQWQIVKTTHPSILASIYATTVRPQDVLYTNPARHPFKQYIGRASKTTSGQNVSEGLWCIKADISSACKKLTTLHRFVLGERYIRDHSDLQIAEALDLMPYAIGNFVSDALDKLTAILDHK
jgi:hypothetical protein